MKKREKVRSFKDNLKNLLMKYSFRPALEMEIICILLVVLFGSYWGITQSKKSNLQIRSALEQTITIYEDFLDELVEEENIVNSDMSLTRRAMILKKLYTASILAGYDADLFILDTNGNVMACSKENISEEQKMSVRNWRILEQILENPEKHQLDVTRGKSSSL